MNSEKILHFKVDTKHRNDWFTGVSFSHPAKMSLSLQLWLIENFTKPGETILDPMAGSGTVLVACSMGRNVIAVELEDKFVEIMKGNWEKIQQRSPQLGYQMGQATILQGDARNLRGLLVDKCIFSPPFAPSITGTRWDDWQKTNKVKIGDSDEGKYDNPDNIGNLPYGQVDKIVTSPPFQSQKTGGKQGAGAYSGTDLSQGINRVKDDYVPNEHSDNLGNLPYGSIDSVITSPPYEGSVNVPDSKPEARAERLKQAGYNPKDYQGGKGRNLQQDWSYHPVDAILTSPPYEGSVSASTGGERDQSSAHQREERLKSKGYDPAKYQGGVGRNLEVDFQYSKDTENIGNLKSTSYLEAMAQVYAQCYRVLKPQGLLILITKNFIRNQKEVRLDSDTIKLCEQAGFTFQERWYRELPAQSFWRVIYKKKYPTAPELKYEDCLVFKRLKVE